MKNLESFKKFLFIATIFVFCIGLCCGKNPPDNDLWARLIAGAHIVEEHSIIKHDFLSYTPTHIWYDHEWGASVVFYTAFKYFGAAGLIILKGILLAFTLVFCWLTVNLQKSEKTSSYNIIYYFFMAFCALNSIGHTVRCLLFTCLFFAIFIYILERARLGKNRTLVLLPFLMLIWCNTHGGCISGLGILGIYALGEFLNGKEWKKYIYTLLPCIAVLFINPYGIEYVKFLFSAALMDRSYITEWMSPFSSFYRTSYIKYKLYLIFVLAVSITYLIKNRITYKKLDKTKFIITVLMIYMSVTHIRHINFFVLTMGTLLYYEFYDVFNACLSRIKTDSNTQNFSIKEIIVYSILLIVFINVISSNKKIIRISETNCPRYAFEFVKINNLKGNLFTNFNWASYAAYKLYPQNLITMDGRYEEVYDPDLLMKIKDFHMLKNNWRKVITDYKTDVMVLETEYPVYREMMQDKDWTLIFQNNIAGVFVPSSKVKQQYIYPDPNPAYYDERVFDTDINFIRPALHSK